MEAILQGQPINTYNHGNQYLDLAYVYDSVREIRLLTVKGPAGPGDRGETLKADSRPPVAHHRAVSIGNSQKVRLLDLIEAIEVGLGVSPKRNYISKQPGAVPATWPDATLLGELTSYTPETEINDRLTALLLCYREYYGDEDIALGFEEMRHR